MKGKHSSPCKERVWRQGPEPVGGHVQSGKLVQLPKDSFCDVVYQVVVQIESVQAGHVLNGLPWDPGNENQSCKLELHQFFQDWMFREAIDDDE